MKTITKICIALTAVLVLTVSVILFDITNDHQYSGPEKPVLKQKSILDCRESITFILGDDKENDNPFYAEAKNYYLYNKDEKTTYMVTGIRHLKDIPTYLNENHPVNNLPWGTINLVSHGNQWIGLSTPIAPGSGRTTAERLESYMETDSLKPLSDNIIDGHTILFVHGCGVGNNHRLIENISKMFRSVNSAPVVRASRLFEYYTSMKKEGKVTEVQRYYANAWMTTYKMGYMPDSNEIMADLSKKYPNAGINWQYALSKTYPAWTGDLYQYTFEVPVKWVIKIAGIDSLPDFSSQKSQCNWVKRQKEITGQLERLEIPAEKFNWWLRKVYVNNPDGTKSPAIWVKGYSTIVCVVQPQIDESPGHSLLPPPFSPEESDNRYFYTYRYNSKGNFVEEINAPLITAVFPPISFYNALLSASEDELWAEMIKIKEWADGK